MNTTYEIEVKIPRENKHDWVPTDTCVSLKQARKRQRDDYDAQTRIIRVKREVVKEVEIR